MDPVFIATRLIKNESTNVVERNSIGIMWHSVLFVEDVTYLWHGYPSVVQITLKETDETICVLDTFASVIDKWDKYTKWIDRSVLFGMS